MAPSTVTVTVWWLLLLLRGCQGGGGGRVSLVCRTDEALRVRWDAAVDDAAPYSLQVRSAAPDSTWTSVDPPRGDAATATVTNLTAATEYEVRVSAGGRLVAAGGRLSTLPRDYVPGAALDVVVTQLRGDAASVDAVVSWTPSPERTCLYGLVLWNPSLMDVRVKDLDALSDAPRVTFRNLTFLTHYVVRVVSKSTNASLEAEVEVAFDVSGCLDWFNDTAICPPPAPVRVTADVRRRHKSVEVSWDVVAGRPLPSGWQVSLSTSRGRKVTSVSLSADARNATFQDLDLDATPTLLVTVRAQAAGGHADSSVWARDVDGKWAESESLPLYVATPVLGVLGALGAASALLARRRRRRRRFQELEKRNRDAPEPEPVPVDEWEVAPERLLLGPVLGEGAFGVVQRGRLHDLVDVAVKMLREDATPEDARQFRREIEMMKSVGPHPHVVSIVGCVTTSSRMRLVVEFCALGDLHKYLHRAHEAALQLLTPAGEDENCTTPRNLVVNQMYDLQQTGAVCLKAADLLSFARQIAMGMEFLASNHVLHRDLAARNVLVCDHRLVKISDFGLSRDVYEQNVYCTSGHGRLPVKWMALESLMHNVYTSQSDVWSFGVLLWEIVTLGANPYPSTPTGRVLKLLRTGYRMECPGNCSHQLYEIMLSCWEVKPKDRPTFTQLKSKLDVLLESSCPQQYLDLNVSLDDKNDDGQPRYLRPTAAN